MDLRALQTNHHDCSLACLLMLARDLDLSQTRLDAALAELPYAIGQAMPPENFPYVPVPDEILTVLWHMGLEASSYRTKDYHSRFIEPEDWELWSFPDRRLIESSVLNARYSEHKCLLLVQSRNVRGGQHLVFWDGKRVLDPDPHVASSEQLQWADYKILEVIVITEKQNVKCG